MLQGCALRARNDRVVQPLGDRSDRTSDNKGFVRNTWSGCAQGVQGVGRTEEVKKQGDW
jgi:hypothetical protein